MNVTLLVASMYVYVPLYEVHSSVALCVLVHGRTVTWDDKKRKRRKEERRVWLSTAKAYLLPSLTTMCVEYGRCGVEVAVFRFPFSSEPEFFFFPCLPSLFPVFGFFSVL